MPLACTAEGLWLPAKDMYGRWTVRCVDASTGEPRRIGDLGDADIARDPDGRRLAIVDQRSWLRILDAGTSGSSGSTR
ncbi:hypothetical protein [Microbacterium sp. gxy059]|uniref:hypothetical protein n=1 Tax=Microbacterium sp. gxy059 TaxID=2957199 RepID=UPI003D97CBC1